MDTRNTTTAMDFEERRRSRRAKIQVQVGRNISKLQWVLEEEQSSVEYCIVGTLGELVNEVSLWKLEIDEDDPVKASLDCLHKSSLPGDVMDLKALKGGRFAVSTSLGAVAFYGINQPTSEDSVPSFRQLISQNLHVIKGTKIPAPATSLASNQDHLISVGEDGSIIQLCSETGQKIRSIDYVDPLSIYSVSYMNRSEIVTGNSGGQLKIWDLRSGSSLPIKIMNPNPLVEPTGVTSIAQHPSQGSVLLVSYHSGSLDLWDMRITSNCEPIANLAEADGPINEIHFHNINPDHFFTCSSNGDVSHWFPSAESGPDDIDVIQNMEYSPDFNIEFLKKGLGIKQIFNSPFPCNSISISPNNRIICGFDTGFIHASEIFV